ncbi:MAG: metallophosphatase domain-containing protein [Myxococcales bacterium]|nr:metallophosphatase domain-containing protein [Myxococcales bacterium]
MTTLVFVSDTHGRHDELGVLAADVLVHCGDGTDQPERTLSELDAWFAQQDVEHVLYVPGNHDFACEARWLAGQPVFEHARVVVDELVEVCGVRIFGSPWVPDLQGWAYFGTPTQLQEAWSRVPAGIDVLATHTPPAGILDRNRRGMSLGCPALRDELARIRPQIHAFGHIHASGGLEERGVTTFVNASSLWRGHEPLREPIHLDVRA